VRFLWSARNRLLPRVGFHLHFPLGEILILKGKMFPYAQEREVNWDKLKTVMMKRRETLTSKFSGRNKASKRVEASERLAV